MPQIALHVGTVADVLTRYPDASFDAVLTDPPYGLGKREWDAAVPDVSLWQEMCRTLVPGGWLLAFSAPRTYHQLAAALENARFDVRDCLAWLYGTGFPKGPTTLKPAWEPIVLARKPGATHPLAIDACRTQGEVLPSDRRISKRGMKTPWGTRGYKRGGSRYHPNGRWPANLLFTHAPGCTEKRCTARCPITLLDKQWKNASRFFYCPKPAGREAAGNSHPCKKPLKLTTYLSRLIRFPESQNLLVPFSGSGSEVIGAAKAGWSQVVAIEAEHAWMEIAEKRLTKEDIPYERKTEEGDRGRSARIEADCRSSRGSVHTSPFGAFFPPQNTPSLVGPGFDARAGDPMGPFFVSP